MTQTLTEAQRELLAVVEAARKEALQLAEIAVAASQAADAAARALAKAEGIADAVIEAASSDKPEKDLAVDMLLAMAEIAQRTLASRHDVGPAEAAKAASAKFEEIVYAAIEALKGNA